MNSHPKSAEPLVQKFIAQFVKQVEHRIDAISAKVASGTDGILSQYIRQMDRDGSGTIDTKEFSRGFSRVSDTVFSACMGL
jgi:hypothetical protein